MYQNCSTNRNCNGLGSTAPLHLHTYLEEDNSLFITQGFKWNAKPGNRDADDVRNCQCGGEELNMKSAEF